MRRLVQRSIITCLVLLIPGWILWAELRGLPSPRSLHVVVPVATNILQGREIVTTTNRFVGTSESGLTAADFKRIRSELRPLAYRGRFFNAVELLSSDVVVALNTNRFFSVRLERKNGSWRAQGLNKAIID